MSDEPRYSVTSENGDSSPQKSLEGRVAELEALVDALKKRNEDLRTVIAGSSAEFSSWNVDNMVPLHDRIEGLEEKTSEHEERVSMFLSDNSNHSAPDKRAMHLRQKLMDVAQGNEDGHARIRRDTAQTILDGSIHKGRVLDAMRRAADGRTAKIDGSSELEPVDGIEFVCGGTVGRDGQPNQSYIEIDTSMVTGTEARQNLTRLQARQNLTTGEVEGDT